MINGVTLKTGEKAVDFKEFEARVNHFTEKTDAGVAIG